MKNLKLIVCILIILFKTGNLFSDNNIFNVNNIEINKDISDKNEDLTNLAFKNGFKELTNRLLLEKDFKNVSSTSLKVIKTLISYYQVIEDNNKDKDNNLNINIFFDKEKIHNFFYERNILYSDVKNTEVLFFPLLIYKDEYFVYSKNYFYNNWIRNDQKNLIQYVLPVESIESIQSIELNKNTIFELNISNFFKEYNNENMTFAIIEKNDNEAKIFLINSVSNKKLNKTLIVKREKLNQQNFNDKIILNTKKIIKDIIKSQNLIDVRTPSFLNVELKINKENNLFELGNRLNQIDLIETFYIQKLTKDYAFVKIKYLGKVTKIIDKLKKEKINLKMKNGQWQISII